MLMQGGGDRRNDKAMCDGGGYLMQTQEVGACGAVIAVVNSLVAVLCEHAGQSRCDVVAIFDTVPFCSCVWRGLCALS